MALLYGTQSNGETLPVLVDQFGNLLAKGIDGAQGPPGQPGQQGQQGIPGDPGAPGQGVPLPYGEDGSYLQIVSGAPEWTSGSGPTPPGPEPVPSNVSIQDIFDTYSTYNIQGSPINPPDPLEWLVSQDSWTDQPTYVLNGAAFKGNKPLNKPNDIFLMEGSFGKVLTFRYEFLFKQLVDEPKPTMQVNVNSEFAQEIYNDWTPFPGLAGDNQWVGGTTSYLINSDLPQLEVGLSWDQGQITEMSMFMRYYHLDDAGNYALNEQLRLKQEVRALREVVMSSNQQSQT